MCTDEIKQFNIKDGKAFVITQSIKKLKEEYKNEVFAKKGAGYSPAYVRDDLTDNLHEIFSFRTDYEITNYENFEEFFKQVKK